MPTPHILLGIILEFLLELIIYVVMEVGARLAYWVWTLIKKTVWLPVLGLASLALLAWVLLTGGLS